MNLKLDIEKPHEELYIKDEAFVAKSGKSSSGVSSAVVSGAVSGAVAAVASGVCGKFDSDETISFSDNNRINYSRIDDLLNFRYKLLEESLS